MKSASDGTWKPVQLPTDKQRWNFLEKIYADYNEVNLQQEEIAERKRTLMAHFPEGNKKEIHRILFGDNVPDSSLAGNWETYAKVEQVLKKFVYQRSQNVFEAVKPDAVFSERINILNSTCAEQRQRIESLEKSLASTQDELAGMMNLLYLKDKEIKSIKMSTRVDLMKTANEQRMQKSCENPLKTNEDNVYKDMSILIDINKTMERENARLRAALNAGGYSVHKGVKTLITAKSKLTQESVPSKKSDQSAVTTRSNKKLVIGKTNLDNSHASGSAQKRKDELTYSVGSPRPLTHGLSDGENMAKGENKAPEGREALASATSPHENESCNVTTTTFVNAKDIQKKENETLTWNMKSLEGTGESMRLKVSQFNEDNPQEQNSDASICFYASSLESSTQLMDEDESDEFEKMIRGSKRLQYIWEKAPVTGLMVKLREERLMWERQLEAEVAHNMFCRDYDAHVEPTTRSDSNCDSVGGGVPSLQMSQSSFSKTNDVTSDFCIFDAGTDAQINNGLLGIAGENVLVDLGSEDLSWNTVSRKAVCNVEGEPSEYESDGKTTSLHSGDLLRGESNKNIKELHSGELSHRSKGKKQNLQATILNSFVLTSQSPSGSPSHSVGVGECHSFSSEVTSTVQDRGKTVATLSTQVGVELSPHKPRLGDVVKTSSPSFVSEKKTKMVSQLSERPVHHTAASKVVKGNKKLVNNGISNAGRQNGRHMELCKIVRGLKSEMATVRENHHAMRREMNELFCHLSQLVVALRDHTNDMQQHIITESETLVSEMEEDMVKDMVERRVRERLEKLGIVLKRYPGPSSGLTDEEWVQNQLYDFIFKSSRDEIARSILNDNDERDEGREAQNNNGKSLSQYREAQTPETLSRKPPFGSKNAPPCKEMNFGDEKAKNWHASPSSARIQTSAVSDSKIWPFATPVGSHREVWEHPKANSEHTENLPALGFLPPAPWESAAMGSSPSGFGGCGNLSGNEKEREHEEMERFLEAVPPPLPYEGEGGPYRDRYARILSLDRANFASPLNHEGLCGNSYFGVGAAVPPRQFRGNILEYLRALQPRTNLRSVKDVAPTVYKYVFQTAFEKVRCNLKRIFRATAAKLEGPHFEKACNFRILPYATAAKHLQNGRRMAPWILAAIRQLRNEERKRNEKIRRVIFQRVSTNIRAKRLLKSGICKGPAMTSFMTILWKKWLENAEEEYTTLRLEREADLNRILDLITANLGTGSQQRQNEMRKRSTLKNPLLEPSSLHFSDVRLPPKRK